MNTSVDTNDSILSLPIIPDYIIISCAKHRHYKSFFALRTYIKSTFKNIENEFKKFQQYLAISSKLKQHAE